MKEEKMEEGADIAECCQVLTGFVKRSWQETPELPSFCHNERAE